MNRKHTKGAAATGHKLTTRAALQVMDAGGNAFDGAIAAAFMACFCEPVLASPGGGGFAMLRHKGKTSLLDFFAQTPVRQSKTDIEFTEIKADFGTAIQTFHIGAAASATPGFIPGILDLHKKHGQLPLEKLIEPARNAATTGVPISSFQYFLSTVVEPILMATEKSRKLFAPTGDLLKTGEIYTNNQLAEFFDQLGKHGAKAFPLADILAAQKQAGHLQIKDFNKYEIIERRSLAHDVEGASVHLNPLPAAGGVMIASGLTQRQSDSPVELAKALQIIDNARRENGSTIEQLLKTLGPPAYRGTTHISVIDHSGNACSMTLSNGEGNGDIVGDCGFMLNNMLGETDINPGGKLGWPTNTRMSSMMCPTIVEGADGSVFALGSGGSNRIRSTIFAVLVNLLAKNQSPEQAVLSPRFHVENNHLDFEDFFDTDEKQQLIAAFADHRVWPERNLFFGGCHIAGLDAVGNFTGTGDPRRHGCFDTC